MGKGDPEVKQESTLIPSQEAGVDRIMDVAVPGIGPISETGVDMMPAGMRLAPMEPQFMDVARGAIGNLTGGLDQVFDPMFSQFENKIAPQVMAQFAGMGNAASGGAQTALARAGSDLTAQIAPLYLQSQMGLPGLAQQAGGFVQGAQQQPLDVQKQMWMEERGLAGPYLDLARSMLPSSNQFAENIASPGQQGFMQSMAPGIGQALGFGMMGI